MNNANKPARAWLLELMGEHDFTMPTKAFNGIAQEIARFEALNHGLRNRNDNLAERVQELEAENLVQRVTVAGLRDERARVLQAVEDAAYEWGQYVEADHAPMTLEKYMREAIDAALATTKEQHD